VKSSILTIVIPTRDRPVLLELGLRSIFEHQTVIPEVIVSDNSTSSHAAITRLQLKYGFAYVRRSGEMTMADHMKACLELPTTRWMMIMDDDDELYPNSLQKVVGFLDASKPTGLVVGGVQYIDSEGTVQWEAIPRTGGPFVSGDGLRRLGLAFDARSPNTIFDVAESRRIGYPSVGSFAADYTLFCQLAYFHGVTFFGERLGRYRWSPGQSTNVSTPESVAQSVRLSAQMAELLRPLSGSDELADLLVDNNTWAFFVWVAPRWLKSNPAFVVDLCHECLRLSPRPGSWQNRARRKYPFLFSRTPDGAAHGSDAGLSVMSEQRAGDA
jgi:Glycosyl transferase family 2